MSKPEQKNRNSKSQQRKSLVKPITCYVCGVAGGTMVKDDRGYKHSNQWKCYKKK